MDPVPPAVSAVFCTLRKLAVVVIELSVAARSNPPSRLITGPLLLASALCWLNATTGPVSASCEPLRSNSDAAEATTLLFKLSSGLASAIATLRLPPASTRTSGPLGVVRMELFNAPSGPLAFMTPPDCTRTRLPPSVMVPGSMRKSGVVVVLVKDPPTSSAWAPRTIVVSTACRSGVVERFVPDRAMRLGVGAGTGGGSGGGSTGETGGGGGGDGIASGTAGGISAALGAVAAGVSVWVGLGEASPAIAPATAAAS